MAGRFEGRSSAATTNRGVEQVRSSSSCALWYLEQIYAYNTCSAVFILLSFLLCCCLRFRRCITFKCKDLVLFFCARASPPREPVNAPYGLAVAIWAGPPTPASFGATDDASPLAQPPPRASPRLRSPLSSPAVMELPIWISEIICSAWLPARIIQRPFIWTAHRIFLQSLCKVQNTKLAH